MTIKWRSTAGEWKVIVADSTIGKRLKELRERVSLSMYELARQSGVSGATLSRIEQGDRDPSWSTIVKLARALGVSVAEFDVGDQPREESDETPAEKKPPHKKRKK
jgi:transcriptional regulator with XRE-family HTH domain